MASDFVAGFIAASLKSAEQRANCTHGGALDCDACPWDRVTVEDPADGSSGGCRVCQHIDGDDGSGSYMLDYYVEPSTGDVVCPKCYPAELESAQEDQEANNCPSCGADMDAHDMRQYPPECPEPKTKGARP